MEQTVSFPARFFAYGIMIVYFLFFQVYAAYAQSGSAYKQVYTTSEGKIQVGTYTRSQVSLRALTPVVPQENDRLQATLDQAAALTKAGDLVIDLSLYPDELFRTRPLYVRNGVKTTFVNGTMVRGVELRDSATLVISHDSRVEWGGGAVLTGESRVAGPYVGQVVATGYHGYMLSAEDLSCFRYATAEDTQWDIHLGGETAIKGNVVLHEGTKLQIGSYLQNDLHLAYQGTDVLPGTVVACGTGDYTLTRKDLDRIINVSGGYDFVLENGSIIIRTTPTGNDEIETATFRAVVQAGCLILSGLAEGSSFRIYDAGGKFVSQGRIQAGGTTCRLPGKGVFFIVGKETYVKVMNR